MKSAYDILKEAIEECKITHGLCGPKKITFPKEVPIKTIQYAITSIMRENFPASGDWVMYEEPYADGTLVVIRTGIYITL